MTAGRALANLRGTESRRALRVSICEAVVPARKFFRKTREKLLSTLRSRPILQAVKRDGAALWKTILAVFPALFVMLNKVLEPYLYVPGTPSRGGGRHAFTGSRKPTGPSHMLRNMFKGAVAHGKGGVYLSRRWPFG